MFGIDNNIWMIIILAAVAAGAVSYAFLFTEIEAGNKTQSRIKKVKSAETDFTKVKAARDRVNEATKRRKSVQENMKELEQKKIERIKKSRPNLKGKLVQSGLQITDKQLYMFASIPGLIVFALLFLGDFPIYVAAGVFFVVTFGVPRFVVSFIWKRRMKKFIEEFPNALEVICRSIKSGLPLNDAMRLIAADGQEPVKSEFRRIIESQAMGISIPDACMRMYNNVPLQEVSFFAIVITIQAQAGGNLSEALGNLARVLRERKKMKAKVAALSVEAKASASIIGALPFIVTLLVYLSSPKYMMILFTDPRGHMIMIAGGFWMSIGLFVMKNMVSFDV